MSFRTVGLVVGGDAHGGTVRQSRTVLHVGAHIVGSVDHRQGEGGGENGRVGGDGVADVDLGGVDVVEVRRAEETVAEALLHIVVAAAVVGHHCRDSQQFILVFRGGDFGNRRAEFGASGKQRYRAKTESR